MSGDYEPVVVDTNVFFSALLRPNTRFMLILTDPIRAFYICERLIVELFAHSARLYRLSTLTPERLAELLHLLLLCVTVGKEAEIVPEDWATARRLCEEIDADDTPHVALTLSLTGLLWTGDKRLKEGLRRKGFYHFFEPAPVAA